jgi:DNA modification methylase
MEQPRKNRDACGSGPSSSRLGRGRRVVVCRSQLALDCAERARLTELEQVVERGFETFLQVGAALLEIRQRKLYREGHETFEDYCRTRWGFGARRARQLIAAAQIGTAVPVENEAQARELAPLRADEAALAAVVQELQAAHGDKLTAPLIREAVTERLAREQYCREPAPGREPQPSILPAVAPASKPGDRYRLGAHRVVCGDATDPSDVARLMRGRRARLLFTSPPYLDLRRFGDGQDLSVERLARFLALFAEQAEILVVNLGLIRRNGEVVRYWDSYLRAAEAADLRLLAWNIWDKGAGGAHPSGGFFPPQHEWLFCFGKEPRPLYRTVPNQNAGKVTDNSRRSRDGLMRSSPPLAVLSRKPIGSVLQLPQEKANHLVGHPAPFPVSLPKAYVETLTEPGDIVVDPFLGSGTTLIACELTGRACYGVELEPTYCDMVRARYQALTRAAG